MIQERIRGQPPVYMGSGLAYYIVFVIIYLLDRANRRHFMVLIEIMIVIVFFSFWVIPGL